MKILVNVLLPKKQREFVLNNTSRPADLPDYQNPPLNEVVLGVQFAPVKGYQQIHAGDVWSLFKKDYPRVEEQNALPPSFETFGLPTMGKFIEFKEGTSHDRFWFLRPDGDELIQFQQDRLLHNWRKVGQRTNEYPRFENMIVRFENELQLLEKYFHNLSSQQMQINQCEISYINYLEPEKDKVINVSEWLRFIEFAERNPDDFSCVFREVIKDTDGKPHSRLSCEVAPAYRQEDGRRIIMMTISVRGSPKQQDINSALEYLKEGRALIIKRFTELTTDIAHKKWGRKK